jgi:hypothetical protein
MDRDALLSPYPRSQSPREQLALIPEFLVEHHSTGEPFLVRESRNLNLTDIALRRACLDRYRELKLGMVRLSH